MPIGLDRNRWLRLFALCTLYVAQGIPYGFLTYALSPYLAELNATEGEIGKLTGIAMLPWAFKWLWGPLIDRYSRSAMGRRRPWILLAQASMVIVATTLIALPSLHTKIGVLGWIMFGINICASLQDVSVDALAVDLLPESERGVANGMMYGASYLGTMLGGAMLATVVGNDGIRTALMVQVGMLGAIMLVPLFLRERAGDRFVSVRSRPPGDGDARAPGSSLELLRNLWRAFARRSPAVGALFALLVMASAQAINAVGTVLVIKRLGWTQAQYGQMLGGLPLIVGLVGSVGGGFAADRIGHRMAVGLSSIALGLSWIAFALGEPLWPLHWFQVFMACVSGFLFGTLSASLFAMYMDVSWPRVAATQFTAYMALLNLSRSLGSTLAGWVKDGLGVIGTYVGCGVLQIAVVLLLFTIDPHQNRRELGE